VEKELAAGWGYNIRNGEITGMEKNPRIKNELTGTANSK
jgi:predicted Zn-dependent protease